MKKHHTSSNYNNHRINMCYKTSVSRKHCDREQVYLGRPNTTYDLTPSDSKDIYVKSYVNVSRSQKTVTISPIILWWPIKSDLLLRSSKENSHRSFTRIQSKEETSK